MNHQADEKITEQEMIKRGLINVLALGYRGVELWRKHRDPIQKAAKKDEEKS